jgi:AraC family transcriptional regulator of arabinose operon
MDRRVKKVLEIIEGNLRGKLHVNELSQSVNLSPSRLHHLFKAELGMPVVQYIKGMRLKQAKELLETSFLTVKEITASVGFKDESRFVQDFKKAYGLTPAQYRRHHDDEPSSGEDQHTKE